MQIRKTCFGENPPPKRGRKRSLDSTHRCGSCTVWLQTGGSTEMLKHHRMDIGRVRHPGERVSDFNKFLSCNGIYKSICLRSDSCLNYVMHVTETVWEVMINLGGLGCLNTQFTDIASYVVRVSRKTVHVKKSLSGVQQHGIPMRKSFSCGCSTFNAPAMK